MRKKQLIMVLLSIGILGFTKSNGQQQEDILLSESHTSLVIIVGDRSDLTRRTARKIQEFIWDRSGIKPEVISPSEFRATIKQVVIVLGYPNGSPMEAELGPRPNMDKWSDEGYSLKTFSRKDQSYILAAGKTERGTKYAAYELMRTLRQRGSALVLGQLNIQRNPFFQNRRVILGIPNANLDDVYRQLKYCIENWDIPKIERYIDVLDFFGFNSIEYSLTSARRTWTGNHLTDSQLDEKFKAMCRRAHENGQTVTLFIGGHSNYDAGSFNTLCPNDPKERALILQEYDRLATSYGDLIDHVHVHWADPGGCNRNGCTIADPQKLTRIIYDKFKAVNPQIKISFSLWYLTPTSWAGYKGPDTILNSNLLPKDVEIALPGARFDLDLARRIRAKGHRVGLWSWYFADMETINGLHYHGRILDHDFDLLPEEAGQLLSWHTLDSVHHGMNLPTLYVGARKLWDPKLQSEGLLKDFTDGVFGEEIGPSVARALEVINVVRCGARSWKKDNTFFFKDYNSQNVSCNLGKGTEDPNSDLTHITKALQDLKNLKVDPFHKSSFPLIVEPQEIIVQLQEHLALMAAYANLRIIMRDLDQAEARHAPREELLRLIKAAESVELPEPKTSFGPLEKIYRYPEIQESLEKYKRRISP